MTFTKLQQADRQYHETFEELCQEHGLTEEQQLDLIRAHDAYSSRIRELLRTEACASSSKDS